MDLLSPSELADIARRDAWFASLPAALAERLVAEGAQVALAQGGRLFARNDPPDGIYCVVRGAVRITTLTAAGKEVLLAMLEPPQWFGEIALFDSESRTHDAWGETPCALLHVSLPTLDRMLEAEPRWWKEFGRLLTRKLRTTFASVEDILLLPPASRVARRLAVMAGGYGSWKGRSKRVLEVSQEQLGLMLALSRQTVNQALKELEDLGLIRRSRGSIEIIDLARLQAHGGGHD